MNCTAPGHPTHSQSANQLVASSYLLIKSFSSCEADRCEIPRLRCQSFWRFLPGSPGPAGSFLLRRWMNRRWGSRCSPSCSRFYLKHTFILHIFLVTSWLAVDIHSAYEIKCNDVSDLLTSSLFTNTTKNIPAPMRMNRWDLIDLSTSRTNSI